MIEVLSKPIDEIGPAEIQALIYSEVPEGEQIEFKKEPPGEGGNSDRRMTGGKIGNYAKDRILKEVIAFANAYGGVLVIGIDESDTKPAVATKITPVPRCTALAESLKLVFRDRVEPQLARIDIAGVPTKEDGSGVIIIRVGKSRLAPHRITRTLICPVRRADRSEEMTMREIQDMTLNLSRGLERLEKRLSERSERFQGEFSRLASYENALGIRLTGVPIVDEIRLDRVVQTGGIVEKFDMPWRAVIQQSRNSQQGELSIPPDFPYSLWRPLLRAARAERDASAPGYPPNHFGYREIHCDGLVEFGFVLNADQDAWLFSPHWPIVMFGNLAAWADHVRKADGAPAVEYALEVETSNLGDAGHLGVTRGPSRAKHLKLRNTRFPRYPLNDPERITELLTRFYRDLWNSMEEDRSDVDFILR